MIKLYNFDELKPEEILNRDIRAEKNVEDVVDGIIADVRARGDDALKDYALKFDGAKIDALQVTQEEIDEAFAGMDPYFLETLREAAANIESFHRQQVHENFVVNDKPGIVLGQKYTPIEKAGVYVPGGTAAYPSTVLMDVIPAKVAGVSEIVMTTPAGKDGRVNPVILAAAATAGVTKIFKTGGAQAVAALAYGTQSIPAVDKIVGPGNIYVATAKRKVFGKVGIDMIAGPSEILVLADGGCNPAWVAADLLSQAEHDKLASPVLVTDSPELAKAVQAELEVQIPQLPRAAIARASVTTTARSSSAPTRHKARSLQHYCTGTSGSVRGGPLRRAERDQKRRQHLPWPQRAGSAGRLLCRPQPHPAHQRHRPLLQPLGRRRLCKEVQFPLLHLGSAGRSSPPHRRFCRARGPARPRPQRDHPV